MKIIETAMKKLRLNDCADVLYACNRKKCKNCSYPICKHTRDIRFAKSYHVEKDRDNVWYVEEITEQPAGAESDGRI